MRSVRERRDGRGYPDRLAVEAIPLGSRIILVADASYAIAQNRPTPRHRRSRLRAKSAARSFGTVAAQSVGEMLRAERITFVGSSYPELRDGKVVISPGAQELHVDRVVSLPALAGPRIPGVPADEAGFHPIDDFCRVAGVADVYAAGDGANFPIAGWACHPARPTSSPP